METHSLPSLGLSLVILCGYGIFKGKCHDCPPSDIQETAPPRRNCAVIKWTGMDWCDGDHSNVEYWYGDCFPEGDRTLTCSQDNWLIDDYYCKWTVRVTVIRCYGMPRSFSDGQRSCDGDEYNVYGSTCSHSCNAGYKLTVPSTVTCRQDGLWSGPIPRCYEMCSWRNSHCWPGDCANELSQNCVCRTGFTSTYGSSKRCELAEPPDLNTCRVSVTDSRGNVKNSTYIGNKTNCESQRDEGIRTQPAEVYFAIKADMDLAVDKSSASLHYVSQSQVGIVDAHIALIKVALSGHKIEVMRVQLTGSPYCQKTVSSASPVVKGSLHDCEGTISVPTINLADGESLCVDMEASSGGYYNLQDERQVPRGTQTYQPVSKSKRVCFTYDMTKPAHCSQTHSTCSRDDMLRLSTRLTRTPEVKVYIQGWVDPIPSGGNDKSASGVDKYRLEVHGVDINGTTLSVQDDARKNHTIEWPADPAATGGPFDLVVTLPEEGAARLYAVILEVHDKAGNVAYARRLLLYDNTSTVVLFPTASLQVVTANPRTKLRWQTNVSSNVCVDWRDRFFNSQLLKNNFLQPVNPDTGRKISGHYDQASGILPVSGTPNVGGVVRFEISWSRDFGPRTPLEKIANVFAQTTCLREPRTDGETYDVWIRATDIMGNYREGTVRVSIDHTGPSVDVVGLRGRFNRDGLYVHNTTDLSTMLLLVHADDPHSGLMTLQWTLGTRHLADDVGRGAVGVQRLDNATACNGTSDCYCPSVGDCEILTYLIRFTNLMHNSHEGDHHRQYYITITATNHASLITRQTMEILLDESPPSVGVVVEGLRDNDQAEMDFTSSRVVHVHWHGFMDHESGVMLYRVVLGPRCLTGQEMDQADNATDVDGEQSTTSFQFPFEGHYITTVVAYNGAMQPSGVSCSDGITYDTSPPRLLNVSLTHARTGHHVACTQPDQPWLVNTNVTRVRLTRTEDCLKLCSHNSSALDAGYLPISSDHTIGAEASADFCRRLPTMTEDSQIVLPSDYVRLTWAATDEESEMEEYYVGVGTDRTTGPAPDLLPFTPTHGHTSYHARHSGLGHGDLFYIFLRAVSKAGLDVQVTLGPVIIDVTPPDVTQSMAARVEGGYLLVTWNSSAFVDPEQPDGMRFDITFRVGYNSTFITPFLTISQSALTACLNSNVTGCGRYPVSALYAHDTEEGRSFFIQLHVTNAVGYVTTVNTSSVRLPAHFPPTHAVIFDVIKPESSAYHDNGAPTDSGNETSSELSRFVQIPEDVDVIVDAGEICMAWHGLHHEQQVNIEVGLGTSPTQDDLVRFTAVENQSPACINTTSLPVYSQLYSVVRATSPGGSAVFSSDGFRLIPRDDPENRLAVFNGKGCSTADIVGSQVIAPGVDTLDLTATASVSIHSGDLVFIRFTPSIPRVVFPDAVLLQTTLTGHQLVPRASRLTAILPATANTNVTVEVMTCLKDAAILPLSDSHVTVTWELAGPWSSLAKRLRVEVTDYTCVQASHKKEKYSHEYCLLDQVFASSVQTQAQLRAHNVIQDHQYVASVAVCVDNACLDAVTSAPVTFSTPQRAVVFHNASIVTQSPQAMEVDVSAAVISYPSSPSPHTACVFLWTVAKDRYGTLPLTDWSVENSTSCTGMKVHQAKNYTGAGQGTLYACLQPVFPWRSDSPTCHKLVRPGSVVDLDPWHVIELSHAVYRQNDFQQYMYSRQLGSRLHELYDFDLDFARSDIMLSAVVTYSEGRNVTWFLMTSQLVPADGACAGDSDCVTSVSERKGSVVFPRADSKLQDGHVYYICARLFHAHSDLLNSDPSHLTTSDVCGDGVVIDDSPPDGGSVTIGNAPSGYLADNTRVTVAWSGFSDVENRVTSLADNVILNYSVALGSYPGGENLSLYVSVGQRTSWTFQHLNIAIGATCIATVRAEDRVGHVTEVWSKPAILDNTPPTVGHLAAGTITRENYVAGPDLPVHWEGVGDAESGIQLVEVAISTEGDRDDVIPFASYQGNTADITDTSGLVDGHSYVVLIKVTNGAGLTTLMSSAPFIVDSSFPGPGQVWNSAPNTTDHGTYSTDVGTYRVYWSGFTDPHSGLDYYRVGLGSRPEQTDIHPFVYVGQQTSYTWMRDFEQGKRYYVTVEACNKAGLCRVTSSNSMTFDDSPPTPGHVTVGFEGHHRKYLGHNSSLPVQWDGFSDPQTSIQHFSWCVGTAPNSCDVIPFTMTSLLRATVRAGLTLPIATPLYVLVRARNAAGLDTVSVSDSFKVDPSPPEVVVIPHFLSPRDDSPADSQWDRSVLRLAWRFEDPDSAVVSHTINIRSNLTGQLVVDPLILGADTELTLTLEAEHLLADGDSHYAAVTACNAAGLCTTSVSAHLLIDSTPPVVGTLLSPLTWRKISVTTIATTVKYATDSDAAESTISTRTDDLSTDNSRQLSTGNSSTDRETSTSATRRSLTEFSPDNSSAVTSALFSWDLSSDNGSTVTPTTQSTNGLSFDISTASSPSPFTEESRTDVTSPASSTVLLDVMWHRFADAESGVAKYYVTAGRAYNGEELSGGRVRVGHDCESNVQRHTLILSDVLMPGDVIYLSVWAENTLGRHSAVERMAFDVLQDDDNGTSGTAVAVRHSCDVAFCTQECTCAATGQVCQQTTHPCQPYVPDHPRLGNFRMFPYMGLAPGPETFSTSVKCLEGHWQVSDPQLLSNVWRFEWSFSLANRTEGDGVFNTQTEAVWHDVGRNTSAVHCMPGQRVLKSGQSYVLHVRAWLSAQDHVTFLSPPIMVDHTPPQIRRGRAVVESDVTCVGDVDYVTTEPTVTACWDGVFRDAESDVTQYVVWLGTSPYADDHTHRIPVGINTSWTFPTASLQQGTRYYVTVRAVNGVGLITTAYSDGITVDVIPPVTGVVFAAHRYSHLPAQTSTTSLPASWHGFQDAHSGLASHYVAIYDVTDNMTAVTSFRKAGIQTELTLDGLNLEHNHRYTVVVKATDRAGLESQPVESRAILIDVTTAEGVTCTSYQLQEERTLSYTSTSSFLHDSYMTEFSLHVADTEELVQIEMMASNMEPGAAGYLAMEEKKMAVYFQYAQSGVATAQHEFLAGGDGKPTISVEVQARPGSQIQARLYRCNHTAVSQTHSITLRQMSQFDLSVCARIRDKESGIRSLLVSVGTTPGGLQVRPLTPVGHSGHSVVQAHLQHGLPVYATVHAENHAGQWSRFISQPITMDRTPPEVSEVKVTLRYEGEGQDNAPEVWGEARWSAEDAESGVVSCTCSLEGQSSVQPAVQMTNHVTPGLCQWRLRHPQHKASVQAIVSCVNGVQNHATVTSDPVMVLLQPPDLAQATVVSLSNHALVSPFHQSDLGVRSSNSSLHFCWHGVHDPTITRVQYRFLHESRPLTEWLPVDVYKTSVILVREASKLPTGNITAQVRAVNAKSMTSDPVSTTVQLDDKKPTLTGRAASATLTNNVLGLTWQGVFTTSSDIIFSLYAGTAKGYGDVINHVITQATSYSGVCTQTLSSLHVTLQAVRANGMSEIYQAELKL